MDKKIGTCESSIIRKVDKDRNFPMDSALENSYSLDAEDAPAEIGSWLNLDSPVLETDVGLVHLFFVVSCLTVVVSRSSSQGFSPRTQLLLLACFSCNLFLKKLTLAYWWTWSLVGLQSFLFLLFLRSLSKSGIVVPTAKSEQTLLILITFCCALVGIVHYECAVYLRAQKTGSNAPPTGYILPYLESFRGLLGEESFHFHSKNAMKLAHHESSLLRGNPLSIAFLVGFKRSLEGLAILPQYRQALFLDAGVDWRVYRY